MRWTVLLLLLLLPSVLADTAPDQELYDFDRLTLKLELGNQLTIVPEGAGMRIDEVTADLSWFPRDTYRQDVVDIGTNPYAELMEDSYQYAWDEPRSTTLNFGLNAIIETSNEPLPVSQKVPFPITSLPGEIAYFLQPGELIDTNRDIERKAMELAAGKDDLFEVVYEVADWVTTNIEYNLTTLTATASQPSTWVYAQREGVCDEMTSLFISMLRSLGIPARFVSGVSYTNLPEFAEPWGGHGWAEVYFPGTGWVPFDVTYGTYGYIDATHIKLKDSLDAGGSSVDFTMLARDANLLTRSLDIDVEVTGKQRQQQELFTVTLTPFDDLVDLNSYNLITATVKNNQRQYVSARLQLARTENLELLGPTERNILLKPLQTKKLYFLMQTEGLREGYRYEFPVKIYAGFRELADTSFEARQGFAVYDKTFFSEYMDIEEEKPYNDYARIGCTVDNDAVYVGEDVTIDCSLENIGPVTLSLVTGCINGECTRLELERGETASFSATKTCDTGGTKTLLATAENREISTFTLVRYDCLDEANVLILDLEYPASLGFHEQGEIKFMIRKESETVPEQARVAISHDNFEQWWDVEEILQPQKFSLALLGENLDNRDNEVAITIDYQDQLGNTYQTRETFIIEARDFSFFQKVQVGLLNAERWLEGLF